jgi:predicted nucleic acid-binding protein
MTALVDTNVLVYRFDPRNSAKQRIARELLREGIWRRFCRRIFPMGN